ncbi:hypothetical protein B1748_11060 [Paenibacillus sp. MY03]|uniref:glycoside hydrolase family 2 protein n=1 Tax=Paenibacillus sp. MY03 TaxID=302980 RepID=UPI000B3C385C|nr:sugar-binding domain-containing protein [Paenibacillus sp. MY03]OUS76629.1 hypothetical protein B1748_11060 [Paenibacillus sp. MY03]
MNGRLNLSGDDWQLTGWYRNQWRFTVSMELGETFPPPVGPIAATVPGAVQSDLLKAGLLDDPNRGLRSLSGEWVNNREWCYEKKFDIPDGWPLDRCELVFEGLDYAGEISLNGVKLGEFEGFFWPHAFDVSPYIRTVSEGSNHLRVMFRQSPEIDGQYGYTHLVTTLKPRFNYVWDWCPRIVPVGIWQDVCLYTYRATKLTDFWPHATLNDDLHTGQVRFAASVETLAAGPYRAEYRLKDEDDAVQYEWSETLMLKGGVNSFEHMAEVGEVQSWWPNGYGKPSLYTAEIKLLSEQGEELQAVVKTIGFRKLEWVANENAPVGALPYTLVVNGKRIFIKGVNWVPIKPLYGSVTEQDYQQYVGRFCDMNVNLLRVWGGAIIEQEAFFQVCDGLGLLVWQEFPQSSSGISNLPPDDPAVLATLERAAAQAIRERRSHPSLAVWCGGNELMWEGGVPVDERHLNIAMLKRLVAELDPGRRFLPASASGPTFVADASRFGQGLHHDVHGPWQYLGDREHYAFFNSDDALFRSETGTPGTSRAATIRKWADGLPVWPPTRDNPYWVHRGAWWIQWEQLGALFGLWAADADELDLYCRVSRYMQAESLRYAVEATRRREPEASGFIVWMGNEPFPNNANTSVIEYDGMPKPAYYVLKKAYAGLHLSARYSQLAYKEGDTFACGIFIHNEHSEIEGLEATVNVSLYGADGNLLKRCVYDCSLGVGAQLAGDFSWIVERPAHGVFVLRLEAVAGEWTVERNEYAFAVESSAPLEPLLQLPRAQIVIEREPVVLHTAFILVNVSPVCAIGLMVMERDPGQFVCFDRNMVVLLPGERLQMNWAQRNLKEGSEFIPIIEGLNVEADCNEWQHNLKEES